ncbi:hypothetical protein RJT34_33317 [Clitoria ternatea]|uniref:Uncharacterized protein n=1 Tax=Clitoria ternatea TaxID=43366 RepID=A0AAN9EXL5_CLITE
MGSTARNQGDVLPLKENGVTEKDDSPEATYGEWINVKKKGKLKVATKPKEGRVPIVYGDKNPTLKNMHDASTLSPGETSGLMTSRTRGPCSKRPRSMTNLGPIKPQATRLSHEIRGTAPSLVQNPMKTHAVAHGYVNSTSQHASHLPSGSEDMPIF